MNIKSDRIENTDFKPCILKFAQREYLESLKNGYVYFKEIQYFRNIETEGQADSREGKIRIRSLNNITVNSDEVTALLSKLPVPEINISNRFMAKTPIFSSVLLDETIIENIDDCEVILKQSFINEMKKWNATIMLIDLEEFLYKIKKRCNQLGIFSVASKVIYNQEKDIFDGEEIRRELSNNYFRQIFCKHSKYADQNEYRITVLNERNDLIPPHRDCFVLKIEPLENCSILDLPTIEELGVRVFRG